MPKSSPYQGNFNAGEVSHLIEGRIDISKYQSSGRFFQNWLPLIQGPMQKRPGTRFVKETKFSDKRSRLIDFIFNEVQSYNLEFGDKYIRFYTNNGVLLESNLTITNITNANPAVVTIAGHGFSNGDEIFIQSVVGMTEVNGKYYKITVIDPNTFSLNNTNTTAFTPYSSGGTAARVLELTTPYLETELLDIQKVQSADVLYIAHKNHPPAKLSRLSATSWSYDVIDFDFPPFNERNTNESLTIIASAVSGNITLTANSTFFTANQVGGHIRLDELAASEHDLFEVGDAKSIGDTVVFQGNVYEAQNNGTTGNRPPIHETGTQSDGGVNWLYLHSGKGYAEITGFTSGTVVNATVKSRLPDSVVTNATFRFAESAWSPENGYPSTVIFHEDRLWWSPSVEKPNTVWGSKTSDFENHFTGPDDDDGIIATFNSNEINAIQWMLSTDENMTVGTSRAEITLSAADERDPITPSDIRKRDRTSYGSRLIRPVRIGSRTLFVQRSGKKMREFEFEFDSDSFEAEDITLIAENITYSGIVELDYSREPQSIVYAVRDDGLLISLTYEKKQEVIAWGRHLIGGTNAKVLSCSSIPHPDEDQEQTWVIVERTINGSTQKYVEYFEKPYDDVLGQKTQFFVDSGLTLDSTGVPVSSVSGLDHLEGETVKVFADGFLEADKVVTDGSITLDNDAEFITIGLPFTAKWTSQRIESGAADGVAQGKVSRIDEIVFRLFETGGGFYFGNDKNTDLQDLQELIFEDQYQATDEPTPLFSGDTEILEYPSGYSQDESITIEHREPLACTVICIMPQQNTQDR